MQIKHRLMKLALVASISSLGACSNEDTSTYVFPQNEFTAIHQEVLRVHWGTDLVSSYMIGTHTIPEIRALNSNERMEVMGSLFEDIVQDITNPTKSTWDADTGVWFSQSTVLARIEAVPGMTELLDICIHQVQDLSGACLWDNWSILSDAWEALGRSHP